MINFSARRVLALIVSRLSATARAATSAADDEGGVHLARRRRRLGGLHQNPGGTP